MKQKILSRLFNLTLILALAACAESLEENNRANLGLGNTVDTELLAQVQTSANGPRCTAVPEFASVASGEIFSVQVTVTNATAPISVAGLVIDSATFTEVEGTIRNRGTEDIRVMRSVSVTGGNGSGYCTFLITVRPE